MKKLIIIAPLLFLLSGCGADWFPKDGGGFDNNTSATSPTPTPTPTPPSIPATLSDSTGSMTASNLKAVSVLQTAVSSTVHCTMIVTDRGVPGGVTVTLAAVDNTGAELATSVATGNFLTGSGEQQSLTSTDANMTKAIADRVYSWKFKQVDYVPYQ